MTFFFYDCKWYIGGRGRQNVTTECQKVSILCSENQHFQTLPLISQKLMMVERQIIPHLKALDVSIKMS